MEKHNKYADVSISGSLVSMKMIWIVCYCLRSDKISNQFNTYEKFWTDAFDSALHHRNQNIKWGHTFQKNGVHWSSRAPETCSGGSIWAHTLLSHFVVFYFNFSHILCRIGKAVQHRQSYHPYTQLLHKLVAVFHTQSHQFFAHASVAHHQQWCLNYRQISKSIKFLKSLLLIGILL